MSLAIMIPGSSGFSPTPIFREIVEIQNSGSAIKGSLIRNLFAALTIDNSGVLLLGFKPEHDLQLFVYRLDGQDTLPHFVDGFRKLNHVSFGPAEFLLQSFEFGNLVGYLACLHHVMRQYRHLHDRQERGRQQHSSNRSLAQTKPERLPGHSPKKHNRPFIIRGVHGMRSDQPK